MLRKFEFYRRHGVEEYYVYDPDPQRLDLSGFVRQGDGLVEVPEMNGHVSPRLGVRFELSERRACGSSAPTASPCSATRNWPAARSEDAASPSRSGSGPTRPLPRSSTSATN